MSSVAKNNKIKKEAKITNSILMEVKGRFVTNNTLNAKGFHSVLDALGGE